MITEGKKVWGTYDVINKNKIVKLKPNESLSLQYHNYREEFWKIISGNGIVIIDNKKYKIKENDEFYIRKKQLHRIIAGKKGIIFFESACGSVDENDIVRIKDKYGRIKK